MLFFKPGDIDVESVTREKCSKVDTNINAVIDFAKWIDNAVFKRPEINFDDVLEFVVGPCIDSAELWSDINKTVFYNGYIAGLAGIIETIFISSDGKFYNHKHELIAENEEDFGSPPKLVETTQKMWYNVGEGVIKNGRRFQKHGGKQFEFKRTVVCRGD